MLRMMAFLVTSSFALATAAPAAAKKLASTLTKSEKALLESYENCQHWAGEEPYDEARSKEINEGTKRDCDTALSLAEKAFKVGQPSATTAGLILRIVDIAPMSEQVLVDWKKKTPNLCKVAEPYFSTKAIKNDPDAQSTASVFCSKKDATKSQ